MTEYRSFMGRSKRQTISSMSGDTVVDPFSGTIEITRGRAPSYRSTSEETRGATRTSG